MFFELLLLIINMKQMDVDEGEGEGHQVKKVEFLTLVGRLDQSEQATHPPPDQHQQILQSQ